MNILTEENFVQIKARRASSHSYEGEHATTSWTKVRVKKIRNLGCKVLNAIYWVKS